jgi:hypothetical protein
VIYILLYVDDLLIACSSDVELSHVKRKLMERLKMADLGNLKFYLGIKIDVDIAGMYLSQKKYMEDMLSRYNICLIANLPNRQLKKNLVVLILRMSL